MRHYENTNNDNVANVSAPVFWKPTPPTSAVRRTSRWHSEHTSMKRLPCSSHSLSRGMPDRKCSPVSKQATPVDPEGKRERESFSAKTLRVCTNKIDALALFKAVRAWRAARMAFTRRRAVRQGENTNEMATVYCSSLRYPCTMTEVWCKEIPSMRLITRPRVAVRYMVTPRRTAPPASTLRE